ncbi:MAG: hypothetical protein RIQ94_942 [Pseudomonadota bacterium]|jgi:hypothetical chaperone protein
MNAGIDFGTSNCSIGVWKDNQPSLLKLEDESTLMASALYTSKANVPIMEIDENELRKRVATAKRTHATELKKAKEKGDSIRSLTNEEIENREHGVMRRELAEKEKKEYEKQTISDALYSESEIVFGEAAIKKHIENPQSGYFIKSPKSFLGAKIMPHQIELFTEIITRMLAHIKDCAQIQIEKEIDSVVIGRPVNFHGTRAEDGNKQALGILERSAIASGFKNVEFLYEPIAAALDYERGINKDLIALVLDAGGGTTDCSMVKVGPSYKGKSVRDESILGYAGTRIGGTDMDIKLAMRKIMPYFGKDSLRNSGLPIPSSVFWNAVSINDVNAQTNFFSEGIGREIEQLIVQATEKQKVTRLRTLYKGRYSYRLNRSSELAKISLSDRDLINLPLRYIESDFVIEISKQDLRNAISEELTTIITLMKDVERQAQTTPNVIYVTGGVAKSPIVQEYIRSHFSGQDIIVGNLFGSVTSGLTTWAHRIFR